MPSSNNNSLLTDAEHRALLEAEYRLMNARRQQLEEWLRRNAGPHFDEYLTVVQRQENATRALVRVM